MIYRHLLAAAAAVSLLGCQAETFTSEGPTGLEVVRGVPNIVSLSTRLDSLLVLRVVDQAGDPIEGVEVSWRVIAGDGEVIPSGPVSGPDGLITADWRFNVVPGTQEVQVEVAGLDPVTFRTEARAFRAIQVTAGYSHGCALDEGHRAWCWGGDPTELGLVDTSEPYRPVLIPGGHLFEEIQAGSSFTCGRTASGEVWCWGYNFGNVVSPAAISQVPIPVQIAGLPAVTKLRAGEIHACAIATDQTTWCWGLISDGSPAGSATVAPPTQVVTGLQFRDLALGDRHTCGLTAAGTAYCWGLNSSGQLGDSGVSRNAPSTPVGGAHSFVTLGSGDTSTCGLETNGEVWCWGANEVLARTTYTPALADLPGASGLSVGYGYIAVTGVGGNTTIRYYAGWNIQFPAAVAMQGVREIAGRASYCLITRYGDVHCSGSLLDGGNWSTLPPTGVVPDGPVPRATGGQPLEWWERQDWSSASTAK